MDTEIVVKKNFKYRLYPSAAQTIALDTQLAEACRLYNAALQERRDAYRMAGKSLNYCDQANQLKDIRAAGDLDLVNAQCAQDVLRRLDKAFKAFFTRIKRGRRPVIQGSGLPVDTTASLSPLMVTRSEERRV